MADTLGNDTNPKSLWIRTNKLTSWLLISPTSEPNAAYFCYDKLGGDGRDGVYCGIVGTEEIAPLICNGWLLSCAWYAEV